MVDVAAPAGADGSHRLLTERLRQALSHDSHAREHLADAGTTIGITIDGAARGPVVLSLTTAAVAVLDDHRELDAVIRLSPSQAQAFASGSLALGPAIGVGQVEYDGSLRDYLDVDPIMRGALRRMRTGTGMAPSTRGTSQAAAASGPPPEILAIETREVHKRFGAHEVLRGASLRIPAGTVSAVLGPSGTGKSVLIKHIIGALTPDRGEVFVAGRNLRGLSDRELQKVRRDVGVMYQDGALFSSMTVFDNVAFSLREHTNMREREIREIVTEHLQEVGLERAGDLYPAQLSGGMRKRAGLARAVVLEPRVLLCDEPDSGLDPVRTALLGELLLERHALYGGTTMVVTHNIELARAVAEHVSLLWRGQVVASGLADDVFGSDDDLVRQFINGAVDGPLGMD